MAATLRRARMLRQTMPGSSELWSLGRCATPTVACPSEQRRGGSSGRQSAYDEAWQRAEVDPEGFWAEAAKDVTWFKPWQKVLDNSRPPFQKWFVGAEMNTCYNAVDRHVEGGRRHQTAIIYDSPVSGIMQKYTYGELLDKVSRFATVLTSLGVTVGDRVLIYMPMVPEAIITMLACARIGAIHSLVFGGFAAKELSARINHSKAKVVVSANCGLESSRVIQYKPILTHALELSQHKPSFCVILNRKHLPAVELRRGKEFCFDAELERAQPMLDCVRLAAAQPLYLLYTSGTTGTPKAIVRSNGGHAVVLRWSMKNIWGINPGEVWWAASDLGWVVGHSYICYGPLLHGATTVLFEGKPVGTPDASTYFRIISDHKVAAMFTAPTALRAIRREDPDVKLGGVYGLQSLRSVFVAGEHCDHETMTWARQVFTRPVLDNWWQTETGWPITSSCVGLGNSTLPPPGVAGKPVPGWNVKVLRDDHSEASPGELGNIVVKLPLPPGFSDSLWESDQRFVSTYFSKFPGYYDTMDAGYKDENGFVAVLSRTDDIINVAGHRLSTSQLEEAVMEHESVAEAAVVGIKDELKGQVPLGVCVLKADVSKPYHLIMQEVVNCVRSHVGPVASFRNVVIVSRLPKTRSGKVARNTIAAIASGEPYQIPSTIEDASVYPELTQALKDAGFPQ